MIRLKDRLTITTLKKIIRKTGPNTLRKTQSSDETVSVLVGVGEGTVLLGSVLLSVKIDDEADRVLSDEVCDACEGSVTSSAPLLTKLNLLDGAVGCGGESVEEGKLVVGSDAPQ